MSKPWSASIRPTKLWPSWRWWRSSDHRSTSGLKSVVSFMWSHGPSSNTACSTVRHALKSHSKIAPLSNSTTLTKLYAEMLGKAQGREKAFQGNLRLTIWRSTFVGHVINNFKWSTLCGCSLPIESQQRKTLTTYLWYGWVFSHATVRQASSSKISTRAICSKISIIEPCFTVTLSCCRRQITFTWTCS